MAAPTFHFLFREAEGKIGAGLWARASALPVGIALLMSVVALTIAPGPRDLGSQPFFSWSIVAVHAYLIVYAFALILLAVAQYYVSAKRFNDLGMSPGWAGLAPFSLLLAGAALWYQPRSEGVLPAWCVYLFCAFAIGIVAWNIVELGLERRGPRAN